MHAIDSMTDVDLIGVLSDAIVAARAEGHRINLERTIAGLESRMAHEIIRVHDLLDAPSLR